MRQSRVNPALKSLLTEATQALARLDADRLEELASFCRAMNHGVTPIDANEGARLAQEAREAASEMAVFGRVLEATRANLRVMERLRNLREGRQGYGDGPGTQWTPTKEQHGDN